MEVKEGETGFLIDPDSTEQIADCLVKLLACDQLSCQMGQKGCQIALERFHPHAVAQKTKALYAQIISEN